MDVHAYLGPFTRSLWTVFGVLLASSCYFMKSWKVKVRRADTRANPLVSQKKRRQKKGKSKEDEKADERKEEKKTKSEARSMDVDKEEEEGDLVWSSLWLALDHEEKQQWHKQQQEQRELQHVKQQEREERCRLLQASITVVK